MFRQKLERYIIFFFIFYFGLIKSNYAEVDKTEHTKSTKIKELSIQKNFPSFNTSSKRDLIDINNKIQYNNTYINTYVEYIKNIFINSVNITLTKFEKPIIFMLSRFDGDTNFINNNFKNITTFTWNTFSKPVNFTNNRFDKEVYFNSNIFYEAIDFNSSRFLGPVDFNSSKFYGVVNFTSSIFFKKADFHNVLFNNDTIFKDSNFEETVEFANSTFNKNVNFDNVVFASIANFSNVNFNGKVSFKNATMPDYLDISYITKIFKAIDLTETQPPLLNNICNINLLGSDISLIKLRYDHFKLYFPPKSSHGEIMLVYERLLKSFEISGLKESYKKLSIEFKQYKYRLSNKWFINLFEKYWWNYGFDKQWIFYWILTFLLLLTILNSFFYSALMNKIYELPFLRYSIKDDTISKSIVLSYVCNLPYVFVYTTVLFFSVILGFQVKLHNFKSKNVFINTYIISIMLLGVICTLFILTYFLGL